MNFTVSLIIIFVTAAGLGLLWVFKHKPVNQVKPDQHVGCLLIKRDSQGAQAFVHFHPDFDLFQYKDEDYIVLKVKVEEVID